MLKIKKIAMLGFLAGLLSVTSACWAASSITGDQVEYDFKTGQAAAVGNVKIRHDDLPVPRKPTTTPRPERGSSPGPWWPTRRMPI